MSAKVNFINQPKLSEHEADREFNERRTALVPHIDDYLSKKFEGEVDVSFAHTGISSLVSIIEASDEKYVLKIPLNPTYAQGEALFLSVWEKAGVKVPHIFEEGILNGYPYILMEHISAPLVMDAYSPEELTKRGTYHEMGQILRSMHVPKAQGFGRVVGGKAEFVEFSEWLYGADVEERITYVKEHQLLDDVRSSIDDTRTVLAEYVPTQQISYCHDDFGSKNLLATNPMTVFDPNPRFNNGYIDLGRSMLLLFSHGVSPAQLVEGYFGNDMYNKKVLHAAVILNTYMKLPYWHKVNRTEQLENIRQYLANAEF
jgi:fructosamine-3-kinase